MRQDLYLAHQIQHPIQKLWIQILHVLQVLFDIVFYLKNIRIDYETRENSAVVVAELVSESEIQTKEVEGLGTL